jgi:hypothetical protein
VANGFTPLLKQVVLWIFIALKNSLSSARFEPENLGLNGKHDNHQITGNNMHILDVTAKLNS